MKLFFIACCSFSLLLRGAFAADETNTFAVLVTQRGTFTNATIRSVNGGYAIVIYSGGGQRIPLSELPEPVQKRYAANASQPVVSSATRQGKMSPAEYLQWQKDHAPELLLQRVNAQIPVVQAQIAALQQRASELRAAGASRMPTLRSPITSAPAVMLLFPGATNQARPALDVYNDQLRDLISQKEQLQQVILARQRAQFDHGN